MTETSDSEAGSSNFPDEYRDDHETIQPGFYIVNVPESDRPHEGQFLGVLGYNATRETFLVLTEALGESGEMPKPQLEKGIESGAFVRVERPHDLRELLAPLADGLSSEDEDEGDREGVEIDIDGPSRKDGEGQ